MTPLDTLYAILSIAVASVAIFLCWALYEVARLVHQSNAIVEDTRCKVRDISNALDSFKDLVANPLALLGLLAKGGKTVYAAMNKGKKKKSSLFDEEDEE